MTKGRKYTKICRKCIIFISIHIRRGICQAADVGGISMNVKEFPAGTVVVQSEQPINALHVIAKSTVRATYPGGEF